MRAHAKRLLQDPTLREEADRSELRDTLVRTAPRIEINGAMHFIVEGDLALDWDGLAVYALRREQPHRAEELGEVDLGEDRKGLVGTVEGGKPVRWPDGAVLTYCIERESFGDMTERYQQIAASVQQAAREWQSICGVQLQYVSAGDIDGPVRRECLFRVRHEPEGQFLALSFFPNDPPERRLILVSPSYFGPHGFDRTGVFRHELGHVLGFRHEHIRSEAPPVCPGEPLAEAVDLTKYDPQSVMHYFCGHVGDKALRFTELDVAGAVKIYGPPRDRAPGPGEAARGSSADDRAADSDIVAPR